MQFELWLIQRRLARIERMLRVALNAQPQIDALTTRLHDAGSHLAHAVRDASSSTE